MSLVDDMAFLAASGVPWRGRAERAEAALAECRREALEEAAKWHDAEKEAKRAEKHETEMRSIGAAIIANVHEESAEAIRALAQPPAGREEAR
jgi:hypothetical protein